MNMLYVWIGLGTFAVALFVFLVLVAPLVLEIGGGVVGGILVLGGIGYLLYKASPTIDQWWQARKVRRQADNEAKRERREARRMEEEARRAQELERRRGVVAVEAIP